MQFNSSLNKQESILALTQETKEQKVQDLSLSVTRMSPDGVCVQVGDWEKERKKFVENNYLLKFHTWSPLDSYLDSSPKPQHKRKKKKTTPSHLFFSFSIYS